MSISPHLYDIVLVYTTEAIKLSFGIAITFFLVTHEVYHLQRTATADWCAYAISSPVALMNECFSCSVNSASACLHFLSLYSAKSHSTYPMIRSPLQSVGHSLTYAWMHLIMLNTFHNFFHSS